MNKQGRRTPLSVSQNFLTSRRLLERIVSLSHITLQDDCIEIGPGKGHITRVLLKRCKHLTAVELDSRLFARLSENFNDYPNLALINSDFLHFTLPERKPYKIFANIPFAITTAIVKKITEARNPPVDAYLVMEKGAAKRFAGIPAENKHSLWIKPFFSCRIVYYFQRTDFHPMPGTDVVLVHFSKKAAPDIPIALREKYQRFITESLRTPGQGFGRMLTKRQIHTALKQAALPSLPADGAMLYVQWLCLFRCWVGIR